MANHHWLQLGALSVQRIGTILPQVGFCKESHPIDVGMEFRLVMVAFDRLLYSYICVCQMEHTGDGTCLVLHVSCVSRFIHTSLEIMEQQ